MVSQSDTVSDYYFSITPSQGTDATARFSATSCEVFVTVAIPVIFNNFFVAPEPRN